MNRLAPAVQPFTRSDFERFAAGFPRLQRRVARLAGDGGGDAGHDAAADTTHAAQAIRWWLLHRWLVHCLRCTSVGMSRDCSSCLRWVRGRRPAGSALSRVLRTPCSASSGVPVTTFRRRLASPCTRPWSLRRPAPGDRTTVGLASTPSISHGTRWGRRFPMRDASPTVSMYWVTWFAGAIWKNRLIHAIVRQIVWIMTPRDCSEDPRVPLQQFVRPTRDGSLAPPEGRLFGTTRGRASVRRSTTSLGASPGIHCREGEGNENSSPLLPRRLNC